MDSTTLFNILGDYKLILTSIMRPSVQVLNVLQQTTSTTSPSSIRAVLKAGYTAGKLLWNAWGEFRRLFHQQVTPFAINVIGKGRIEIRLPSFIGEPHFQMLAAVIVRGNHQVVGFTEGRSLDTIYRHAIHKKKITPEFLRHPKPELIRMNENQESLQILLNVDLAPVLAYPPLLSFERISANQIDVIINEQGNWMTTTVSFLKQEQGDSRVLQVHSRRLSSWGPIASKVTARLEICNYYPIEGFNPLLDLFDSTTGERDISFQVENGLVVMTIPKKPGVHAKPYWFEEQ